MNWRGMGPCCGRLAGFVPRRGRGCRPSATGRTGRARAGPGSPVRRRSLPWRRRYSSESASPGPRRAPAPPRGRCPRSVRRPRRQPPPGPPAQAGAGRADRADGSGARSPTRTCRAAPGRLAAPPPRRLHAWRRHLRAALRPDTAPPPARRRRRARRPARSRPTPSRCSAPRRRLQPCAQSRCSAPAGHGPPPPSARRRAIRPGPAPAARRAASARSSGRTRHCRSAVRSGSRDSGSRPASCR